MAESDEKQYIDLVQSILNNGTLEEGRNGKTYVKTKSEKTGMVLYKSKE